jgi:AraC family transcriptional regulator
MFHTQTINGERYSPFVGQFWEGPPQSSKLKLFGGRTGDRLRGILSDLSQIHPEAVITSSQDLGWQNIRVLHMRHTGREMEVPPLENHCMILSLGPHGPQPGASASIDGYDCGPRLSPGEIAIIPAGVPSRWRWHSGRSRETLHIYLHPEFVRKTAEMCDLNHGRVAIEPQLGIRDEQLSYLAMSLLYEMKEENVVGRLYADSVASVIAIQLVRRYSCLKDVRIIKGGMAPHKLRRAIEQISDHLEQEQEISLAVVAEEVGMSYYHFSRSFKHSIGLSPINYITRQRIERAKKLLAETELPISEIALRTGFSSQSHFTTSFRRLAGITPSSFRRGIGRKKG